MAKPTLWWLIPVLVILPAVQVFPQTVANPRTVEFDPSADHNALTSDGQPMVTRYDLLFYQSGATQPYRIANLGKPTPDPTTGKIVIDFSTRTTWPLPDGTYQARVSAVGPTGSSSSDISNSFTFAGTPPGCAYTVSPTTASVAAAGGTSQVSVTTTAGCGWTATSGPAWITANPTSGSGGGTVTLMVGANAATTGRIGTVIVGGQVVTVTQVAAGCAVTVSPAALSIAADAGTWPVTVTAGPGCPWTAAGDAGWIAFSPTVSNGSGAVTLAVMANTASASRTGTVTIGGQAVSVTQAGGGVPCSYSVSPTSALVAADGGRSSVSVTTTAGCDWSAATGASWITVSSRGGRGKASVVLTAAPNTAAARRTGTVTVAGKLFTLTQRASARREKPEKPERPLKPKIIIHSGGA